MCGDAVRASIAGRRALTVVYRICASSRAVLCLAWRVSRPVGRCVSRPLCRSAVVPYVFVSFVSHLFNDQYKNLDNSSLFVSNDLRLRVSSNFFRSRVTFSFLLYVSSYRMISAPGYFSFFFFFYNDFTPGCWKMRADMAVHLHPTCAPRSRISTCATLTI